MLFSKVAIVVLGSKYLKYRAKDLRETNDFRGVQIF